QCAVFVYRGIAARRAADDQDGPALADRNTGYVVVVARKVEVHRPAIPKGGVEGTVGVVAGGDEIVVVDGDGGGPGHDELSVGLLDGDVRFVDDVVGRGGKVC